MFRHDDKSTMLLRAPNMFENCSSDPTAMLKDIAYVLHLTRQVKAEMLEDRAISRARQTCELALAD